jgi:hypothetical protein
MRCSKRCGGEEANDTIGGRDVSIGSGSRAFSTLPDLRFVRALVQRFEASLRYEPDKADRPQSRRSFGLMVKSGAHYVELLDVVIGLAWLGVVRLHL